MGDRDQQRAEPELFASFCAIELPTDGQGIMNTWTTSVGSGSDVDD